MYRWILLLSFFAHTQLSGQIDVTGTVIDENGQGLPFVNVLELNVKDSSLIKIYSTDEDGKFKVSSDHGSCIIKFEFIGYMDKSVTVQRSFDLGMVFMEIQSHELEELTIRSSRPLLERSRGRLIVNVENSIFSSGSNALETLKKAPTLMVDHENNVRINGRTGARIYIDGKDTRLYGDQLTALLEGMPSEGIERIEIMSNPSAKYEAQGSAGVIDIITKRSKLFGTNGTVSITPGLGRYFRWENGFSINHRTEKINLFGSYNFAKRNQYMEIFIDRRFLSEGKLESIVDMHSLFKLPIENHSPRIGLDYELNDKMRLGFVVNGFMNLTGQDAYNDIITNDGEGDFILAQHTDTHTNTDWFQYNSNINYEYRINGKSNLSLDLDYARYNNLSDQIFESSFFDKQETELFSNALIGTVDGYLNLAAFNLDFETELSDTDRLEIGWKNTNVTADNELEYFDETDGNKELNTELSNRFEYKERVYAAYANYMHSKGKWDSQYGLRMEKTIIEGQQYVSSERIDNNYTNLFPNVSVNYKLNDQHNLGVSFSRRLNRPRYSDLNPFRFFVNNYTYRVGNPKLSPQFSWTTELSYTLRSRYHISLSYGLITDNLTRAIFQEEGQEYVVIKPVNIDDLNTFSINISGPVNFSSRWTSQWHLSASFNEFKGRVGGYDFHRYDQIYMISSNHNYDLGNGYRLQMNLFYLPSHFVGISKIEDLSQIYIGIQKRILDDRMSLRLGVNDIFYQGYPVGRTEYGDIDDRFISKRDSQYGSFSISYNFGKQSVRSRANRRSAIHDELRRAQQDTNN